MKSFLLEHYKKKYKVGGTKTPVRKTGMWYQNGDVVVPSNQITMKGPQGEEDYFDSPIMGIGMQSGQTQVMQPGEEYFFPQDEAVYETMMQSGGIRTSLDNISPEGDVSYSATAKEGPLSFRAASQTNLLTGKQQLINPTVSAQLGNLGLSATPTTFSADYQGSKGYASMFRDEQTKGTDLSAGLNLDNFNLDANAFLEGSNLKNIGAAARYQATPNLAFTGNINYSPEEGTPNYNVGFTYSKKFQGGGMSIPGVNGTIVAAPMSLKDEYKKSMKKGGQHGGLDRWFAEKWVDVKSGKPCGRQEGENRAYPACRPSKRVNSKTPKTSSEMSSKEKAKFKSSKTSSQRIPYNHKRK